MASDFTKLGLFVRTGRVKPTRYLLKVALGDSTSPVRRIPMALEQTVCRYRFNVCVFAYGQTGSGKTWTMTGGKGEERGLTPRVIEEIFANMEKSQGAIEVIKSDGKPSIMLETSPRIPHALGRRELLYRSHAR